MANIPGTKYAQGAPSANTGQTTWQAPRDSGYGQKIANILQNFGADVANYALNAERKKMVAEISLLEGEIDERGNTALQSVTGDSEADEAIYKEYETWVRGKAQSSEYVDVNTAIGQSANRTLPGWHKSMTVKSIGIQSERAGLQTQYGAERKILSGDVDGGIKDLENAKRLDPGKAPYYDEKIRRAPITYKMAVELNKAINMPEGGEEYIMGLDLSTDDKRDMVSDYKFETVHKQDKFDVETGKTALDWDKKLQAWDNPSSEEKLSYEEINAMEMPEFADKFGNNIIKFKEYWRGLLDAKVKAKETGEDATSVSDMIQAERIVRSVGSRRMTLDQALKAFEKVAPNIKSTDNKSYIAKIFAAEEATRVPVKQVMNDQLSDRQKKVRDAIEDMPNFLIESEGKEILQDLANQAAIDLGDKYGDLEWDNISDLDTETDRLIRKYSPSAEALATMVINKQLMKAETFE